MRNKMSLPNTASLLASMIMAQAVLVPHAAATGPINVPEPGLYAAAIAAVVTVLAVRWKRRNK